jgi:hypothetical protein
MTQPQIIDGGKSPQPHHPAVIDPTMTERARCLAIIDKAMKEHDEIVQRDKDSDLLMAVYEEIESRIRHIRALIQYGVKP